MSKTFSIRRILPKVRPVNNLKQEFRTAFILISGGIKLSFIEKSFVCPSNWLATVWGLTCSRIFLEYSLSKNIYMLFAHFACLSRGLISVLNTFIITSSLYLDNKHYDCCDREIIISATKTSESPRAIPGSHGPMVTAWGQLTDHPATCVRPCRSTH